MKTGSDIEIQCLNVCVLVLHMSKMADDEDETIYNTMQSSRPGEVKWYCRGRRVVGQRLLSDESQYQSTQSVATQRRQT